MEELALLIDEMEYNNYILHDLTPEETNPWKNLNNGTSHSTSATESGSDVSSNSNSNSNSYRSTSPDNSYPINTTFETTPTVTPFMEYTAQASPPPPPPPIPSPTDVTVEWNASFTDVPLSHRARQHLDTKPSTRIPKIKPLRSVPSRRRGATESPSFSSFSPPPPSNREPKPNTKSHSPPKSKQTQEQPAMKIEERWNLAQTEQRELLVKQQQQQQQQQQHHMYRDPDETDANEETFLMEGSSSNKRLLQQFRGCVKCLLE
jgi:hypothetical protein